MKCRVLRSLLILALAGLCLATVRAELDPEDYLGTPPPSLSPEERKQMEAAVEAAREEASRHAEARARVEEEARRAREAEWAALSLPARLTVQRCTGCHEASAYEQRTYTRLSAEATILRMQWMHDAHLEPGERSTIAGHLVTNFGAPRARRLLDVLAGIGLVALAGLGIRQVRKRRSGQSRGERNR
jgi:hypothetical protein